MFKRTKLTVADLTSEDIADLLHKDQRRRANRKVGYLVWPLLYVYARHLKQKQIRETPAYQAFPHLFKNV